jgi:phosphate transport system permease protein
VGAAAGRISSALRAPWPDRRAEGLLGASACLVLLAIVLMLGFVLANGWPSFEHNGFSWFTNGDTNRNIDDMLQSGGGRKIYTFHAWPLIWATILTTLGAVICALVISLFAAIFVVEFAPERVRRVLEPVVRLLAAVPSVVYGLIGALVLVPFLNNHIISEGTKRSVQYVVQLDGNCLLVAVAVLTVMITPIMTAITVDALRAVPRSWTEGAAALGANDWRVVWTISVRACRPAIFASVILATARALGEAIMLALVAGGVAFAPNLLDGPTFFFEPARPIAATIVLFFNGINNPAFHATLFALASVLLVSALFLSLAGWAVKRPLRKYGVR